MAKTSSAKKAQRSSSRKRTRNALRKKAVRGSVKEFEKAVSGAGNDAAQKLSGVFQTIDKALKRGIIKKNTAARMKSRLSRMISKK